jgi:hypothetical protein
MLAFTVNQWGFYFEFWDVTPILKDETASAIPFNLGIYPVLASFMIYLIKFSGECPIIVIMVNS